jgi:ADP-ribose pyrophosphatase
MKSKPQGERVGWRRLNTEYPYSCSMFRLRRDRILINDRHQADFNYLETHAAVWVVPVTSEGLIVLIRQYRYAVDEWIWEVPAGGMSDHTGDLESLARRELAEEVGGEAGSLQYLGWFFGGAATSTIRCHIYLAHDTQLSRQPEPETMEMIEIHQVPVAEALRMSRCGEMRDGRSALALLWSEPYLRAGKELGGSSPGV